MPSSLQVESLPSAAPPGMREQLCLNLQRSAAAVGHQLEQKLRPRGLSSTQYNVLRILRGAGMAGLCQYEIGERLVAQVPDVPRILERMEKAGWVKRERAAIDRRMVMASLTEAGRAAVDELDEPVLAIMNGLFLAMTERDMQRLNELLVAARNHPAASYSEAPDFNFARNQETDRHSILAGKAGNQTSAEIASTHGSAETRQTGDPPTLD